MTGTYTGTDLTHVRYVAGVDESARQYAAAVPMIALGIAALISAWAVFVVVLLASPWAVSVLLPWSHRLRSAHPRLFAALALAGAVLVLAAVTTAFSANLGAAATLTAGVALLAYAVIVGHPLLRGGT